MTRSLDFYFDFASPYAWFALPRLCAIAENYGCSLNWHPILLWAVRKAQGMSVPFETPSKEAYMLHDIERTARVLQRPYAPPPTFGASSHLATRVFYGIKAKSERISFAQAVMDAHFTRGIALGDVDALAAASDLATEQIKDLTAKGRDALIAANDNAVVNGVWGSPYVMDKDEAFFGVDRLDHLDWHLHALSVKGN